MDAKVKHLEFLQAAISRMSTCSFAFKGWALTVAAGISTFGTIEARPALLGIVLISTCLFWGLDGYYLWLERGFITLYEQVARASSETDFSMRIDKANAARGWFRTCWRPHLVAFYGTIVTIGVLGMIAITAVSGDTPT